jgi:hypothetical protein
MSDELKPAAGKLTAMPSTPAETAIALRIREILAAGAELSPEVMRFVDSTFSVPSTAELAAILSSEADGERESLLELLFSPDESLQIEIEELLAAAPPPGPQEDRIVASLCRPALSVAFRLAGGRGVVKVAMTPPLARRFVHHLNAHRRIPEPVAAAAAPRLTDRARLRLRVLLRNARFDFSPTKTEFLCRLTGQLDFTEDGGWEALAFALELLAEVGPGADIGRALEERKKLLVKALHHGRQLREQLAADNIETLLSRGQRLTWVDETATLRQLDFIDRICRAAFGRIVHLDPVGPDETVAFSGLPDLADFLRRRT